MITNPHAYKCGHGKTIYIDTCVVGVMKMGNTMPRVGLEHASLAFWARALPLHRIGSLTSLLYPCQPVYVAPCLRG